jgi:hypothetical protein
MPVCCDHEKRTRVRSRRCLFILVFERVTNAASRAIGFVLHSEFVKQQDDEDDGALDKASHLTSTLSVYFIDFHTNNRRECGGFQFLPKNEASRVELSCSETESKQ